MRKDVIQCSKRVSEDTPDYSCWQMRCLCLVADQLQPLLKEDIDWANTKFENLEKYGIFNDDHEVEITMKLSDIDKNRNGIRVLNEIKKMFDIPITWDWMKNGKATRTVFYFIHRMEWNEDNLFSIYLSHFSVRWILEFGKRQGFLSFDKPSMMMLSSSYSMRLFLMLSQWYSKGEFSIGTEELKKRLCCPLTYTPQNVEDRVLKSAQKEMESKDCRLSFEYKFVSNDRKKGVGRKRFDTVVFTIIDKEK